MTTIISQKFVGKDLTTFEVVPHTEEFFRIIGGSAACINDDCGYVAEPHDEVVMKQHEGNLLTKTKRGLPSCPLCHRLVAL